MHRISGIYNAILLCFRGVGHNIYVIIAMNNLRLRFWLLLKISSNISLVICSISRRGRVTFGMEFKIDKN